MTAINSVNFKGNDEQRSSGPGLGTIAATTVVGGAGGYFLKKKVSLDGLDKDAFVKATKDFTGEDKANADAVKAYLEKPVEEKSDAKAGTAEAETKTDAEPKAGAKEKAPKSLVGERDLDQVFGKGKDAKTEIEPNKYYEKYGIGADRHVVEGKKISVVREMQTTKVQIEQAKKQAKITTAYVDNREQANSLMKQIEQTETEMDKKIDSLKEQAAKKKEGKAPETVAKIEEETQEAIKRIKKQEAPNLQSKYNKLASLNESVTKIQDKVRFVGRKGGEEVGLVPDETTIQKALKEKGLEAGGKETQKLLEAEWNELTNDRIKALRKEHPETVYDFAKIKEALKQNAETRERIQEKVAGKIEIAKAKEIEKLNSAHLTKLKEMANGKVVNRERHLAHLQARLDEITADINLVETANKNKQKITRVQAEEVQSTSSAKVKSALKEVGEKAGKTVEDVKGSVAETASKALESLKDKLPKEFKKVSGKAIAVGAVIGLGVGLIAKWMFGGKSEE